MEKLQTQNSKILFDILETAARLHDNLPTELPREEVIVDIIPWIEQAMEQLGYGFTQKGTPTSTHTDTKAEEVDPKRVRRRSKKSDTNI